MSLVCEMCFLCFHTGTINKAASVVPIWFIFLGKCLAVLCAQPSETARGFCLGVQIDLHIEQKPRVTCQPWNDIFVCIVESWTCQRKCGLNIGKPFVVISQISAVVFLIDGCIKSRSPSWFVNSISVCIFACNLKKFGNTLMEMAQWLSGSSILSWAQSTMNVVVSI